MANDIKKIAFIGNYLPRRCGIATFTTDICEAFAALNPSVQVFAIPVTDIEEGYDYPERVRFEIKEQDIDSYKAAADFLNLNDIDVVCLQHEFGIFGGDAGGYILALLRQLKMPIITTLHTVLKNPSARQRRVMDELLGLSDYAVVMTQKAADILQAVNKIHGSKIRLVPHGIPDVSFIDPNFYKDQYGVEGKTVLLTFGLLSPRKGIEVVLRALPKVIKERPSTVYIVVGATHPNLLRHEGESYRLFLQRLCDELEISRNVIFHNRFVSSEELKELLVLADIYITPYFEEAQVVSGTLAYSFGVGNAVISTPYWHAAELLSDGRGILVPFNDPEAIGQAVTRLIVNENERNTMRKNAYLLGREMIWSNVASKYTSIFEEAKMKRSPATQKKVTMYPLEQQVPVLPDIKLDHLVRMTDSIGIFQHATFNVPNFSEGYCTDDNARALILTVLLENLGTINPLKINDLSSRYLGFVKYAWDPSMVRFRNFLTFQRNWKEETSSEDCHGRAIWAIGTCIGRSKNEGFTQMSVELFEKALAPSVSFTSPRAWAFILLGIHEYLQRFHGDRLARNCLQTLAARLHDLYKANSDAEWRWFESSLTYCDAKLPHALLLSGHDLDNEEMLRSGVESLSWLTKVQTSSRGHFQPVGTDGEYIRGGVKPVFDQQPVEAYATVSACLDAYRVTKDKMWYEEALNVFQWFLGSNDLGISLYDPVTGGCCDGLHINRVNRNQGAESTLSFLLSLTEMTEMENVLESLKEPLEE
ncbi:MAG: glycosyltransferase family 4 protein [Candidatus Omnitrophica bacterium]|nr:glycosyltransferase family 4 protein [Candidatus Omnitrophota bacterium]MDD5547002.1 glycosyltransferase family 4 protein [Candidatus Omnitrophota bacterium]